MKQALFTPAVFVDDEGVVTIDWSDSFQYVHDEEAQAEEYEEVPEGAFSGVLDRVLGFDGTDEGKALTSAQRIRRLAEYMEGTHGSRT